MLQKLSLLLLLLVSASHLQIKSSQEPIDLLMDIDELEIDITRPKNKTVIVIGNTMVDRDSLSPLEYAVSKNNPQRVATLLQMGHSSNGIAGVPLEQFAKIHQNLEVLDILIQFKKKAKLMLH